VVQILSRIVNAAANQIFPLYCVLCFHKLDPQDGNDIPLCAQCRQRLPFLEGGRCRHCGRPLYSEKDICYPCRDKNPQYQELEALFPYKGQAAALLKAYKMGKRPSLAPFFASLVAKKILDRWNSWTIVPVPPRAEKLQQREWDQVEALARILEKKGIKVARPLARIPSREQKSLDRADRLVNAKASYRLNAKGKDGLLGLSILLLDDVCTTGATLDACASVLLEAGAKVVCGIVLAVD